LGGGVQVGSFLLPFHVQSVQYPEPDGTGFNGIKLISYQIQLFEVLKQDGWKFVSIRVWWFCCAFAQFRVPEVGEAQKRDAAFVLGTVAWQVVAAGISAVVAEPVVVQPEPQVIVEPENPTQILAPVWLTMATLPGGAARHGCVAKTGLASPYATIKTRNRLLRATTGLRRLHAACRRLVA
jgi:hypothetical protein